MVASRVVAVGLGLGFGLGLGLAPSRAYCGPSDAGFVNRFVGARIVQIMAEFGLPDRILKTKRGRNAYYWRLEPPGQAHGNDRPATEFFCEVTVVTSPRGRVTHLKTEVSNAGAGVYAAVGAFGRLCQHSFGLRTARAPKISRQVSRRHRSEGRVDQHRE